MFLKKYIKCFRLRRAFVIFALAQSFPSPRQKLLEYLSSRRKTRKYRSDKGEEKRLEDTKECALYCTVSHRFDAKLLVSFEASLCLFLRYSNQFQIRISLGERRCSLGAARRRKALWIKTNDTTKQAKLFFLLSCVVFFLPRNCAYGSVCSMFRGA